MGSLGKGVAAVAAEDGEATGCLILSETWP